MIRDRLRRNLAFIHEALRQPEDFAIRWHLEGQPYSWSVFAALALTAIAGTTTYGLIVGVAAALYLTGTPRSVGERLLRLAMALHFWPFYLPILLARPATPNVASEDELERMIVVVERELESALSSNVDWSQDLSEEQSPLIDELLAAWKGQSERIREMDRLLARPEYLPSAVESSPALGPRARQSLAARNHNLERLHQIRQRVEADLLASVRELASRIQLARFTDAAQPRTKELLAEIAAAIENLSPPPAFEEQTSFIKKAE